MNSTESFLFQEDMMKNKTSRVMIMFLLVGWTVFAQEIKFAVIVVDGIRNTIHFTNVDGVSYLSWPELAALLPNVVSLSDKGEITITTGRTPQEKLEDIMRSYGVSPGGSGTVIESRIDGEFTGWDGDTIFRLQNGQIWQQSEYAYTYSYKYMPRVTLYQTSRGWTMKVDGMEKEIRVTRIK
jgi:hypothetical protein